MERQLAAYIRHLREAKHYTTYRLAAEAGCSRPLITGIENNRRIPNLRLLWNIMQVLDGDFKQALYYLCVDAGVPPEGIEDLTE